jgi:Rad3-related DNA helicase
LRAKCSEGISFNDHYARGVILVGIAFPSQTAPEVKHKIAFNDWRAKKHAQGTHAQQRMAATGGSSSTKSSSASSSSAMGNQEQQQVTAGSKPIGGGEWYTQEAFRSINQALGRCIRHANDYGALFLLDCRWETQASRFEPKLAHWIQAVGVQDPVTWGEMTWRCRAHFAKNATKVRRLNFGRA